MEEVKGFVIESDLLPEWLRAFFVDDDGEVFLSCGAFDNERMAFLCMAHDGVPMVRDEGHVYAPASWIAKQYPCHADAVRTIAENAREKSVLCTATA
jgi:hypothetical protein